MATKHSQHFCQVCDKFTLHVKDAKQPAHLGHLFATLLLALFLGPWCILWIVLWMADCVCHSIPDSRYPARCTVCGSPP